jgi:hypothetical protein
MENQDQSFYGGICQSAGQKKQKRLVQSSRNILLSRSRFLAHHHFLLESVYDPSCRCNHPTGR